MDSQKCFRIFTDVLLASIGSLFGAFIGILMSPGDFHLDEAQVFTYVAPGAAVGAFLSFIMTLCCQRKMSLSVFAGAMLGATFGIGLSVLIWYLILEPAQFEPPGGDIGFILFYFGFFSIAGVILGINALCKRIDIVTRAVINQNEEGYHSSARVETVLDYCPDCGAGGIIPDKDGKCTNCGYILAKEVLENSNKSVTCANMSINGTA